MGLSLMDLLSKCNAGCSRVIENSKGYNDSNMLKVYEDQIRKHLNNSSNARWELALTIARLIRSGAWCAFSGETHALRDDYQKLHGFIARNPYDPVGGLWYGTNTIYLLTFLREKFGLCRTTVYSYLEVVDEFATYVDDEENEEPKYIIGAEAKHFQFFQLVEMVSLNYAERLKVKPNWTRQQIRDYKKSLREKAKITIQPAEQVEAEEKPRTESQQRFAKYSKDDLINYVVELEEKNSKLKSDYNVLIEKVQPYAFDSSLFTKRELERLVSEHLKRFDYQIFLNGRKQGEKAFSGVIAKVILNMYGSKIKSSSVSPNEEDLIQGSFAI